MIPDKKDLVADGLNLLLYQFSDKVNIKSLMSTYLQEIENVDKDLYTLVDSFNIENATGVYLDYIGRLVGEFRSSDSDEDFRKRIKVRVLINNSKGTPDNLLNILSELTESDNVKLWEHFPLSTIMYTDGNNATVKTLKGLGDSSPVTSEMVLIVDTTREGFVGDELLPDYNTKEKKSILAEFLEQFDFLVDNLGNSIIDNQGNFLVLFAGGGDTISYYGIFNEYIGRE